MAGHVPFAGFHIGREAGVRFIKLDVLFGNLTSRNREGHIVVKEHLGLFLVSAVLVVVAHAFVERTHAGTGHDLVMVTFRDILLRHEVAINVVPAGLGLSFHVSRPIFHASSSTAPADRSTCPSEWMPSSASKRVRPEPHGPSSPTDTMTISSSGRALTFCQSARSTLA